MHTCVHVCTNTHTVTVTVFFCDLTVDLKVEQSLHRTKERQEQVSLCDLQVSQHLKDTVARNFLGWSSPLVAWTASTLARVRKIYCSKELSHLVVVLFNS